jgi:hypothetical protein
MERKTIHFGPSKEEMTAYNAEVRSHTAVADISAIWKDCDNMDLSRGFVGNADEVCRD